MLAGLFQPFCFRQSLRILDRELGRSRSTAEWVDFVSTFHDRLTAPRRVRRRFSIAPLQIRSEIIRFVEIVRALEPRRIVEVGTASGGSLFLLARAAAPGATLVSVDLPDGPGSPGYAAWREDLYRAFAGNERAIELVRADSHAAPTADRVRALLGGSPADVVFIDGDHTHAGVARDYELYAPLARPGGLIAFHDIVADHRTRFGTDTPNDSGEVHRFWSEIRGRGEAREIVDDPGQDGFGIGVLVLTKPAAAAAS